MCEEYDAFDCPRCGGDDMTGAHMRWCDADELEARRLEQAAADGDRDGLLERPGPEPRQSVGA